MYIFHTVASRSRTVTPSLRLGWRAFAASSDKKIAAPAMVYISGEEMSRYTMKLVLERWVEPYVDMSKWQFYDLSCKSRDDTEDKVLKDAVAAGADIGAIFKEPTITPTEVQKKQLGLRKAWGSPNGLMRRGWNGVTISRDTIHIPGIALGYKRPVLCERHAVGGEYGAGWGFVGKGRVVATFFPDDDALKPHIIDGRKITDNQGVVVLYDNPLDNVPDLARIFFTRCLEADIVPYVVTKKTVFKWQEGFWVAMKEVFDKEFKEKFEAAGILDRCGGELQHLISDAATMQIIRWTDGGFGMACHNYDGDMLTDEVSQVHRSPGFISSSLIGKKSDGTLIKEFEASHGTVADLWHAHLRGEETSMNPLGMVVALLGAMDHSVALQPATEAEVKKFTGCCREAMFKAFREGKGTRDLSGPSGLTTEQFVDAVASNLKDFMALPGLPKPFDPDASTPTQLQSQRKIADHYDVDEAKLQGMFDKYDDNGDGTISFQEFVDMMIHLGIAPKAPVGYKKTEEQLEQKTASEGV